METQKLTVRLPVDDIAFLKGYAHHSGITVTEALRRYVYRLKESERLDIHPDVARLAGLIPADIDARAEYAAHLEEKYQ